ncbi:hypothetical protein [Streptomyces sp. NPDC054771]
MDEINHAMMGGQRHVRTMSSITRTDYEIKYKDGRTVRLTQVDAPAPEGYTQGQAVVVRRPGRDPFTGTVAHIHTAPGYVAVRDDRHGGVSSYPTRFLSAVETEKEPEEADVKEWSGTYSRFNHLHRFGANGRARCNSRIRPRVWAGPTPQGVILHTRADIEAREHADLYTFCPKCEAK